MLASGRGVYRFVMIGQISREQNQLVRPAAVAAREGGIKTIAPPSYVWALFLRNLVTLPGLACTLTVKGFCYINCHLK